LDPVSKPIHQFDPVPGSALSFHFRACLFVFGSQVMVVNGSARLEIATGLILNSSPSKCTGTATAAKLKMSAVESEQDD